MILKNITVRNFRNIKQASLDFVGCRQFLVGPNGQGKTNLLEAIGYVTALRSFRTAENSLLLRQGESEAVLGFVFGHDVMGETPVRIEIRAEGRRVAVDQEKIGRLADFIGKFPAVVFSSDDIQFIRGSPGHRRRWMDMILAAADPAYLRVLQDYHRALKGRNHLVKKGVAARQEIEAFEAIMAPLAAELHRKRLAGAAQIGAMLRDRYDAISSGREEAGFSLRADVGADSAEAYLENWRAGRSRDLLLGSTRRGPHRDDFVLKLDERLARDFGSEGQQRSLALALRLAQADYFGETLKIKPILLADDIVNELDPARRESFWDAIGEEPQLIATGTTLPKEEGWQIFNVKEGAFAPINHPA